MTSGSYKSKDAWVKLMIGVVPEKEAEIHSLWKRYNPDVILDQDTQNIRLAATSKELFFNSKTMDVFWLIGFSAWRVIECYSPAVVAATLTNTSLSENLKSDNDLPNIERQYTERLSAAQTLISQSSNDYSNWPPDIPKPEMAMESITDLQTKAAYDLNCIAVAFKLFHEFRHVMLGQNEERPEDLREEELQCDIWAREFMTSNLQTYATSESVEFEKLLRKRSMGIALAAFTIHEITPMNSRQGCGSYYSVAVRLKAMLLNTSLPDGDHFWNWLASLLVGVYRQNGRGLDYTEKSAKQLAQRLIDEL